MTPLFRLSSIVIAAVWLTTICTYAAELKVGDKAPEFKLQGSDGKTYKLADFRGKQAVVLAWFPKANTLGCTTVDCVTSRIIVQSLVELRDTIRKHDVTYFMVSIDTVEDNTEFAEKYRADFPILADPAMEAAEAYGVIGQKGLPNRWRFYIAMDGTVAAIEKVIDPAKSAEDLVAKLRELKVPERP